MLVLEVPLFIGIVFQKGVGLPKYHKLTHHISMFTDLATTWCSLFIEPPSKCGNLLWC